MGKNGQPCIFKWVKMDIVLVEYREEKVTVLVKEEKGESVCKG